MTNRPGLDFSFSGLKTFAINTLQASGDDNQTRADIALAFELAVVDTLVIKCRRALKQTGLSRLVIAGGVGANARLRGTLDRLTRESGISVHYPRLELCTDNGAMIAYAGCQRLLAGQGESGEFQVKARWPMESLTSV